MAEPIQKELIEADIRRPDWGIVLKSNDPMLSEGMKVVIDPLASDEIEGFEGVEGRLRLLGAVDDNGIPAIMRLDEQALAELSEWVKPLGRRCLILRDSFQDKTESGVHLPFSAQERTGKAVVLEIGKDVREWSQDEKVCYLSIGVLWLNIDKASDLGKSICARYEISPERLCDLALIFEEHIFLGY